MWKIVQHSGGRSTLIDTLNSKIALQAAEIEQQTQKLAKAQQKKTFRATQTR